MKRIALFLFLILSVITCFAQTQIDPTYQVAWNLLSGSGAPSITCTQNGNYTVYPYGAEWGQSYQDTTNNVEYKCTASGWVKNLPITGGTITGSLNVAGSVNAGTTNSIPHAEMFPGATADVKLLACFSALPNGGICDGRGFGYSTQTIASTVLVPTGIQLLLDQNATTFVASSSALDMFSISPSSGIDGLHVNNTSLGNYSGNVIKFPGNCGDDAPCNFTNWKIENGTVGIGITTGTAILMQATSGVNGLSFANISHGKTVGFLNGIFITSTGAIGSNNFVNGNHFNDIEIKNAVNCIYMYSNPGDVMGNMFINSDCQVGPQSITGVKVSGSLGSNTTSNMFLNFNIWDYGTSASPVQSSYLFNSYTRNNWIFGNIPLGIYDASSDLGTTNNIWNINFGPLNISQLSLNGIRVNPTAGNSIYWLTSQGTGNKACIGNGSSYLSLSNPFCIDSSGSVSTPGTYISNNTSEASFAANAYGFAEYTFVVNHSGSTDFIGVPTGFGGLGSAQATSFVFTNNGSIRWIVDSNGNFGIGSSQVYTSDGFYVTPSGATVAASIIVASVRRGTFTCTAGGNITVSNTNFTTGSDVTVTMMTSGGTPAQPFMNTPVSGTSFKEQCGASDTSTYRYTIWN